MLTAKEPIKTIRKTVGEEYEASKKLPKLYVEFFSNPTSKEARSLVNTDGAARFMVDAATKKVYFWNAEYTHYDAQEFFGSNEATQRIGTGLVITGIAVLKGNKFQASKIYEPAIYADVESGKDVKKSQKWFATDWSWAYQWIDGLQEDVEKNHKKFLEAAKRFRSN
jgi:hypothetical protein